MTIQEAPRTWPAPVPQPLLVRVQAAARRLLDLMLCGLPAPGACPACLVSLELVSDQLIEWDEVTRLQGVRFWECPRCQVSTGQCYTYILRDGDCWGGCVVNGPLINR